MTQSNNPSGSKAPGFGAFIGSDGSDNNSGTTGPGSSDGAAPKTRGRSRRKPRETASDGDAETPRATSESSRSSSRGTPRKKTTRRRSASAAADAASAAADERGPASTDVAETEAPRRRSRRTRKPAEDAAREGDAPAENASESTTEEAPRRRSRGTRSRRPRSGEEREESQETSNDRASERSEQDEASPRRSRGRGSRGGRGRGTRDREEDESQASQTQERTESSESSEAQSESGEERPRRKRSRGGRGRSRKRSTETEASEDAEDTEQSSDSTDDREPRRTKAPRRRRSRRDTQDQDEASETRAEDSEATGGSDSDSEDAEPKRRRRGSRGSRGGRGRTKKVVGRREKPGAAVVEFIPGEEDDLPELPDLPDEAELLNEDDIDSGSGRKRSRRKRGAAEELDPDVDVEDRRVARKAAQIKPDRKILVNACDKEETRVAVVRDGKILDFQMNVENDTSLVSDIYRGRIVNIEHSIGAAFVDFGRGRNGFLHTSDVLPTYADAGVSLSKLLSTSVDPEDWDSSSSQPGVSAELHDDDEEDDDEDHGEDEGSSRGKKKTGRGKRTTKGKGAKGGKDKGRQKRFRARPRTPIDELFKVGQKVVVQITKDAIGDKGPTLTTYLSIPGRYLVLMPSISHSGVSRKIEDAKERKRLKRILESLNVPEGMGVIARTATMGHTKAEIKRDLDYLLSAWNQLAKRLEQGHGPAALYQESDVAIRTVRDLFGPETEAVLVDEPETYKSIRDFAELLMPEHADRIVQYEGTRPLFHAEGVEQDFEKIFSRRIELPSGGSIVFDQAEALVAIDVNSGKTRTASHDFEEIALKTNMEAVPEIARQIRLRDLGGIIVVDFIDMMKNSNRKLVEQTFRGRFSDDRARSKVGRISQFGLLEMTRQRLGPGMSKKLFKPCVACRGAGRQRTESSRSAAILRRLGSALTLKGFTTVELKAHPETIEYLKKVRAVELNALESSSGRTLELKPVEDQIEDSVLRYLRTDGREVRPGGRRKR